jgi:hypothetical protein
MKIPGESSKRPLAFFLVAALAVISATRSAAALEQGMPDQIRSAVERSSLSQAEKAEVLDEAGRAIRSGIPADDVAIIVTRAQDRKAGADTTKTLLKTVVETGEKGLPIGPVLNRIEQGLSKGISPEKISVSSRRLAEKLSAAQPIVNDLVRGGVAEGSGRDREYAVETVARALERSIPEDAITRAGRQVKDRKGSVVLFDKAVHTMTNLIENGMPADSASRLVNSAVGRGFSEKDLTKMEREVVEGLGKGKGMDDVIRSTESEIKRDGKGESLRDDRGRGSRDSGSDRGKDRDSRERDRDLGKGGRGSDNRSHGQSPEK